MLFESKPYRPNYGSMELKMLTLRAWTWTWSLKNKRLFLKLMLYLSWDSTLDLDPRVCLLRKAGKGHLERSTRSSSFQFS